MSDDELLVLLGAEDKAERRLAIGALHERLPEVRAVVLALMASADWKVRASAAAVLDHAEQDDEVERALRRAATDPDARVRDAAFHSLSCGHCKPSGCVPDESVDLLVRGLLTDPSVHVRRKIAGGLMFGQQGRGPGVVDAFRTVLERHRPHAPRPGCDLRRQHGGAARRVAVPGLVAHVPAPEVQLLALALRASAAQPGPRGSPRWRSSTGSCIRTMPR